jgi:hypothetical protein
LETAPEKFLDFSFFPALCFQSNQSAKCDHQVPPSTETLRVTTVAGIGADESVEPECSRRMLCGYVYEQDAATLFKVLTVNVDPSMPASRLCIAEAEPVTDTLRPTFLLRSTEELARFRLVDTIMS